MRCIWFVLAIAAFGEVATVEAQMFGARPVGQPLGRRNAPSEFPANDGLLGSERFLRDSRDAGQFVGRDSSQSGFVGNIVASDMSTTVNPAITIMGRPDLSAVINRPVRERRANAMLEPPLTLGFQLRPETIARLDEKAKTSIETALSSRFENQISVSVVNQIATLQGWVRDEEQKRLAGILTELEPGVVQVQNEIEVIRRD